MAERRRSSGSRALDRRNRERAGVLSRRSDAPGGFETDYSAGASLLPEDSASQAPPDRVWKPFEETPAKSDTRRGSRGVHFQEDDVAASQSQADSMTLISSMRQEDIVEGRLKRELIRDLRALPGGCDAAMNANCCTVDVKVAVTRFSQVTAERSLPAGEFRIEYAVIPTSKLIKLRSLCDERLASNVLAKGSTGWRQMDSQTMACSFGTGEWVEPAAGTWQRLRVPDGQCLPNHLNRRYLEFRVFRRRAEGEGGLAEEEEWRHHGGSMRAEMVFRAKVAEAKRSRRSAKIKLKSPDGLSEYELVAAVSMAKISDAQKQPPPPLPPPPKPEVAIAAVRKSRAADIELPPPEAEEAPLVTKGAAEVAANEDADADGGGIDVVKVVRNLGIGLVAGAVMGMGVGALLGWMLGCGAGGRGGAPHAGPPPQPRPRPARQRARLRERRPALRPAPPLPAAARRRRRALPRTPPPRLLTQPPPRRLPLRTLPPAAPRPPPPPPAGPRTRRAAARRRRAPARAPAAAPREPAVAPCPSARRRPATSAPPKRRRAPLTACSLVR
eukprot:TRINITY_DN20192_c0_g1_i3.p1 TRINITY_DN20192_c0_g1~~TRINITY_DN20192_c0_g1_i3.p1  ORF type:complete len:556 (+),score=127.60 TRINITY_DN20192_c0_g1_i3:104-1771(+)